MAKPISVAATARQLPNAPTSAATISGELSWQARHDFSNIVLPWLNEQQGRRPCLAYRASVGVGKTAALIDVIVDALRGGLRVAVCAPTQALASEIVTRLEEVTPGAAFVWRGREQEDPATSGHLMCRRTMEIRAAQAAGGSSRDVCGSKKRGFCKYNPCQGGGEPCSYLRQELGNAHVVIFTGDEMLKRAPGKGMKRSKTWQRYKFASSEIPNLFDRVKDCAEAQTASSPRSSNIDRDDEAPAFDLLIMDETNPFAMLRGFNSPPSRFDRVRTLQLIDTFPNPEDREILKGFVLSIVEACELNGPASYLSPFRLGRHYNEITPTRSSSGFDFEVGPLCESGLNTLDYIEILETVREIAFHNIPKPRGQASFHKLAAEQIMDLNIDVKRRRMLMLDIASICQIMTTGLRNDTAILRHLKVAKDNCGLHVRSKESLSHHYETTPTMIFDATLRPELLSHSYEGLKLVYDRSAIDGNGLARYQLRDRDLSYGTLEGQDWPARLALFSQMCRRMLGPTGLIVPKFLRERLIYEIDRDVMVAHHGALRGLNSMENVSALIVASRQATPPSEAEDLAAVLSTQAIEALPFDVCWYPERTSYLKWRKDPSAGWPVRSVQHPDTIAEVVRAAITEDGLEQALGRGRNVRRTGKSPLTEFILTTTPTNRSVDGTFTMAEFKAAAGWVGAFLEIGFWVPSAEKGLGGVMSAIVRAIVRQRPESLYIPLIGNPAFEGPDAAADWRKKQLADNPEIGALACGIDKALGARAENVEILYTAYPVHDFLPVQAKVRGSRYFAQLYVRSKDGQTAVEALTALLGPLADELEIRPKSTA